MNHFIYHYKKGRGGRMKSFNPLFMIIFWIATLYFSWNWYQGGNGISSWEFHSRLQAGLKAFVIEHLEKSIPDVTDIKFTSLWSSYVRDDEIKVFFEYGFKHPLEDQMTQSQLKGWALLNPTDQDIQKSWDIKEIQINKQSIDYGAEEIIISAAGSIETSDAQNAIDNDILPDREGVKDSEALPDKKSAPTSPTRSTSISKAISDVSTSPSLSTLKSGEIPVSSTTTLSVPFPIVDLKK